MISHFKNLFHAFKHKHWLFNLTLIYVVAILIWFGLWLVVGDGWWWMMGLNRYATNFLFRPAPFIFLLAFLSRRPSIIAATALPLLIFYFIYWPYLTPRPAIPLEKPDLKVLTYNILYSNENDQAIAQTIQGYEPDLVALQEVQPEMMDKLIHNLTEDYPHYQMGTQNPYGTTAIFSRTPFSKAYVLNLEDDRPAVVVQTMVQGQPITFISAHLRAYSLYWVPLNIIIPTMNERTRNQARQAQIILNEIEKQDGLVILGCDCNSQETSVSRRLLNSQLYNAARQVGWRIGDAVPDDLRQDTNIRHIDYVFYKGSAQAVGAYHQLEAGGSDHLPLLVSFLTADQ